MRRLEGKVAFISGGASGIGLATAHRFVEEGAAVVLGDIDRAAGERACAEVADAAFEPLDVTSDEDWRRATDAAADRHRGLHILVNSAGIAPVASIEDVT